MVDYRKRLVDMTPEERAEVAPAADNFSKVFGDRTEEPMSVTSADTAVSLATPVDSVVEVQKELQKEEPDYLKIGMLAGVEALGSIPALGPVAKSMIRKGADLSKQTDTAIEGATNIPTVSKKDVSPFDAEYDYDLTLKMEDMIDEWAMGNVSNADLRKNLATLDIKLPYRIGPKADPSSLDIQMPDGTIYKGTGDVPSKPRPLTLDATSDAVDDLGFSEKDLADWKASNYAKDKFRIPPDDEMAAAATNLREGKITSEEFRKLSDERQPIKPITEMPKFPTKEEVVKSLHATDPRKTKKGVLGVNKAIEDGTPISSRLDIPAYNNSDTWVVSLHDGSVKDGKTVGYGQSAVLNNVSFTSNPLAASKIATGSAKTTIARMQGEWQNMDPEDVYKTVESLFDDPEWVQVGMNPYRASYFYDKADGMPVVSAEQVMQVGPLVFAKKAKKTTPDDPRFEFENKVTGVKANFNEGGMAMNEQMEMAFALGGSVEEVDPVSGNEVPLGSLPEEVRDDIDANLSEGEYVVPADVVRYYGVKFFEDLRSQAKMGFEDMAANGRIGGEPVPAEGVLPFDVSELQAEDVADGPMMMNEGGDVTSMTQPDFMQGYTLPSAGQTQEYKTYVNDQGLTMTIRFVNGQPTVAIPAGYTEVGKEQPTATTPTSDRDREADRPIEVSKRDIPDYSSIPEGKEEADSWFSSVQKEIMGAKSLAGASVPVIGLAQVAHRKDIGKKLDALLKREDITEVNKTKVQTLLDQLNGENEPDFLGGLTNMADSIKSGVSTAADNFRNRAGMFYDPLEDVSDTALRDYGKVDEQGNKQLQTKEERQKDKDQSLSNALVSGGTDAWHKQASDNYRKDMEAAGYTSTPTGFVKNDNSDQRDAQDNNPNSGG